MLMKFLIFGVIAFVLYKFFILDKKKAGETVESKNAKMYSKGKMAKDPICGAYVAMGEEGIKIRDGKNVHRFCSYECRDAFLEQLRESGREIPEHITKEDDE